MRISCIGSRKGAYERAYVEKRPFDTLPQAVILYMYIHSYYFPKVC